MMLVKLIGIALIGVVAVSVLRTAKPEFAAFAVIGTGIVMLITMISSLQNAVLAFDELVAKSGIDDRVFSAVLKVIGIGYLTEYSASVATDAGCASVAQKLQFGGKIVIFLVSMSRGHRARRRGERARGVGMTARLFPSVGERAAARMRKERIFTICVFIGAFLLLIVLFCANAGVAYAATEAQKDVEKELSRMWRRSSRTGSRAP